MKDKILTLTLNFDTLWRMIKKRHTTFYGKVALERMYCKSCECMTIVIDGRKQCCDGRTYARREPIAEVMISMPGGKKGRHKPPKHIQDKILEAQDNQCFYCHRPFGSYYIRNGKAKMLQIHWDHQVPYAYTGSNADSNFVAACNVCNGIKSDLHFENLDDLREYIRRTTTQKGYSFME